MLNTLDTSDTTSLPSNFLSNYLEIGNNRQLKKSLLKKVVKRKVVKRKIAKRNTRRREKVTRKAESHVIKLNNDERRITS